MFYLIKYKKPLTYLKIRNDENLFLIIQVFSRLRIFKNKKCIVFVNIPFIKIL